MIETQNNIGGHSQGAVSDDYRIKPVGTLIDRTMKIIRSKYAQAFKEAGVDITTEQWVILDKLYETNGISQTNLANGTFKNSATVSRIIDLLSNKDLIERQRFENDRRRYKIFLTKTGAQVVETLRPYVYNLRRNGWHGISESEYIDFVNTINKIYTNFESSPVD